MSLNIMILPTYTILSDTTEAFEKWITSDSNVEVLGGHTALKAYLQQLITQNIDIFWTEGECNQSNQDCLIAESSFVVYDLIISVGGGRALDVPKWGADSMKKLFFVFQPLHQLVQPYRSFKMKSISLFASLNFKMRLDISSKYQIVALFLDL